MNLKRFSPRSWLLSAFFLAVLSLTACTGRGETWPGIAGGTENESILVSFRKQIVSLNPDKSRNWTYPGEDGNGADIFAAALVDGDRVYVGDYKGNVHAIDRESGENVWIYEPERSTFLGFTFGSSDRVIGPVALGEGKLFFGNEHGLRALDIENEEPSEAWFFETEHSVWGQPLYVDDSELDLGPTLYVASLDQHIYALDAETGSKSWEADLGGGVPNGLTLDLERKLLYVGTLNSELVAIRLTDGQIVDRFKTEGWVWGNPVRVDEKLYFGDLNGVLYELVLGDGDSEVFGEAHQRQLSEEPLRATPLIVETSDEDDQSQLVLVIGSENGLVYAVDLSEPSWFVDQSASLRWSQSVEAKAVTNLTWVDFSSEVEGEFLTQRLVIVGTEDTDQLVVALRLDDGGQQEWQYKYDG